MTESEGPTRDYWQALDALVARSEVILDSPHCSSPVCYEEMRYPYDHGYLAATRSGDKAGIDVWIGSSPHRAVSGVITSGVITTLDVRTKDAGLTVLIGCTAKEAASILTIHQEGDQSALLILR